MSDESRSICDALAARLAAATTRHQAEQVLASLDPSLPQTTPMPASPPAPVTDAIGIWRRTMADGQTSFVRTHDTYDHLWARVDRIAPKGAAKRVVFLGESCARGWPLDPLFTCAGALQTLVDGAAGVGTVEIVDLAKCAIGPRSLLRLFEAAFALAPDLVVIFAGNNWNVDQRLLDYPAIAAELADTGRWRFMAPRCEDACRRQTADWMASFAAIARDHPETPILWVLPAQEPANYRRPSHLCNPLLASGDQIHRDHLLERAGRLRLEGDAAGAERCAARVVELEDGNSVLGLQELGRCAVARGAYADAAQCFEQAHEVATWILSGRGLHSFAVRRDVLRTSAADAGFHLVDLPRIFEERPGHPWGGHELFLDHVHMTSRGMTLAMAATAERLLPLLGLSAVSRDRILETPVIVDPRADAQGHFMAAHFASPDTELARYHFTRACEASADTVELLRRYADFRLNRLPMELRDLYVALKHLEATFPGVTAWLRAEPPTGRDVPAMALIGEMIGALRPDLAGGYREMLRRECSVTHEPLDLLPYVRATDVFDQAGYLRCSHYRTRFDVLAGSPRRPWRLRLTTRARAAGSVGRTASLYVNETRVQTWTLTHAWSTVDCVVEPHIIEDGVNTLGVVWPDPEQRTKERIERLARTFSMREPGGAESLAGERLSSAEIYLVWGEIHAFTAQAIGDGAPDESDGTQARMRVAATTT